MNNTDQSTPTKPAFLGRSYAGMGLALVIASLIIWVMVQVKGTTDDQLNYYFSFMLGVVPTFGGIVGLGAAKKWGGRTSALGRSVGCLALGVLSWGIGELIWSYYNLVVHEPAPYPSLADIFFAASVLLWIVSTIFLTRLAGVRLMLKRKPGLWGFAALAAAIAIGASYYLLVVVARGGVVLTDSHDSVKVILDITYPLADVISLILVTISLIVSGKYLGGKLRLPIFLSFGGLVVMYLGDFFFSYTTTVGTFYNADKGDLVLFTGMCLLSFALMAYRHVAPTFAKPSATEHIAGSTVTPDSVPPPTSTEERVEAAPTEDKHGL